MEKVIKWITKIGEYRFIHTLYHLGEIYCQTVPFFRKADTNVERFDTYENASYIDQIKELGLQEPTSNKIIRFSKEAGADFHLSNANLVRHDNLTTGNIFSCSGFTNDNVGELKKINSKFREFGDAMILIENPNEFFNRIEEELKRQKLNYKLGLVYYYNPNDAIGNLSVYHKKQEHSYQNEIRLWIDYPKDEPLILKIGSLKDISVLFKVDDILKMYSTS